MRVSRAAPVALGGLGKLRTSSASVRYRGRWAWAVLSRLTGVVVVSRVVVQAFSLRSSFASGVQARCLRHNDQQSLIELIAALPHDFARDSPNLRGERVAGEAQAEDSA